MGLFGKQKTKEVRIAPAEAGKVMAANAGNFKHFVDGLTEHGRVNEIEAWGLSIFCVAFAMIQATQGRLSPQSKEEMFTNFYRTTYEIAADALKLGNDGYEEFFQWTLQRFKEYDAYARQYFFQGGKNAFAFGAVIMKNV